ncbi:MAG: hypothetical protein V7764_16135 [Pseudomonas marincola]|uniref:hypothetical protein n=2 Tax=Pseudomonadaceae TaxID=135621 RepID=UPI003001288C
MQRRLSLCLILTLLISAMSACSTAPVSQRTTATWPTYATSPAHLSAAKAFLINIEAVEMFMIGYKVGLNEIAREQPGMAELMDRALGDVTADDFLNMTAEVYAHYLTQAQLTELAELSDNSSVKSMFRTIRWNATQNKPIDEDEFTKKLDADQLEDLLKFSQSESVFAMQLMLPEINRELAENARLYGEAKLVSYLNEQ